MRDLERLYNADAYRHHYNYDYGDRLGFITPTSTRAEHVDILDIKLNLEDFNGLVDSALSIDDLFTLREREGEMEVEGALSYIPTGPGSGVEIRVTRKTPSEDFFIQERSLNVIAIREFSSDNLREEYIYYQEADDPVRRLDYGDHYAKRLATINYSATEATELIKTQRNFMEIQAKKGYQNRIVTRQELLGLKEFVKLSADFAVSLASTDLDLR